MFGFNDFKDANQSSMMDLEIADYERTVQNLNDIVSQKDSQINSQQAEEDRLNERIESLNKQLGLLLCLLLVCL